MTTITITTAAARNTIFVFYSTGYFSAVSSAETGYPENKSYHAFARK